jgi:trans-aconitate methyltransferase
MVLAWDHNAYYQAVVLRQLPRRCHLVLDVGCGAGAFATRLARRADQVDAVDRSPVMIEAARRRTPVNVACVLADVLHDPLPHPDYDAIVSISALHHMPLHEALPRLATALRPGGVLAVVALPRRDLRRELPYEAVATLAHRLLGATFLVARAVTNRRWLAHDATVASMPVVVDPPLTTSQVRREAGAVLPGAQVRRLLFWRYLLLWRKPVPA